jgi:hypothetical protein
MKPFIFCEPCCGSAAVTVRLLQRYGKPPISYMGGKAGYADPILDALGLVPGQGCDGIVLADVGPWAAVWATLGNAMPPEDAAKWLHANALSMVKNGAAAGYSRVNGEGNDFTDRHGDSGHWHATTPDVSASRIEACSLPASKAVANITRAWKDEEPRALWDRLKKEGWPSLMPVSGGRWLGPQSVEEVAGYLVGQGWSYRSLGGDFDPSRAIKNPALGRGCLTLDGIAEKLACTFPPLACYQGNAGDMVLPDCLDGWIIFLDPPYQGTSGYPFGNLARSEVLRLAKEWHGRGAIVAISEAEPLPLDGWHHVQIDHARKGQKRSFSKQQSEWLTISRPPCHVPAKQMGMFGGGK